MNENVSWGKIVVFVVAIIGVGALGFVVSERIQPKPIQVAPVPVTSGVPAKKVANKVSQVAVASLYDNTGLDFFTIDTISGTTTRAFTLSLDAIIHDLIIRSNRDDYVFCYANQKIYFPYSKTQMGEVDLLGNIRTFGLTVRPEIGEDDESIRYLGFAVSSDCSSVIVASRDEDTKKSAIDFIDVSTGHVENMLMLTSEKNPLSMIVYRWSKNDPSLVYLLGYEWNHGIIRGLYSLNIHTKEVSEALPYVPNQGGFLMDISDDEALALFMNPDTTNPDTTSISVYDFSQKKVVQTVHSNRGGNGLFSPDARYVAYDNPECARRVSDAHCFSRLFILDVLSGASSKKLDGMEPQVWFNSDVVAGTDTTKKGTLISVDVKSGKTQEVLSMSIAWLQFIPTIR